MGFEPFPPTAAWRHQDSRTGFEVAYFHHLQQGCRISGCTAGMQDDEIWSIRYEFAIYPGALPRGARVEGWSESGVRLVVVGEDRDGRWYVDGKPAPHLDGCLDVDLETSAMTNALPVRRMSLAVGERADAPAVWVRTDLSVERLEQVYARVDDSAGHQCYDYRAPTLDFACRLEYDESGLVLDYPGIAARVR